MFANIRMTMLEARADCGNERFQKFLVPYLLQKPEGGAANIFVGVLLHLGQWKGKESVKWRTRSFRMALLAVVQKDAAQDQNVLTKQGSFLA